MKTINIIFLIYGFTVLLPSTNNSVKTVQNADMQVEWWFNTNKELTIKIAAPDKGWVALGFNEHQKLENTYLLMIRPMSEDLEIVPHYIYHPGDYRPITVSANKPTIKMHSYTNCKNKLELTLTFTKTNSESLLPPLYEGKKINLLTAYSDSKDFQHHSIARKSFYVKL